MKKKQPPPQPLKPQPLTLTNEQLSRPEGTPYTVLKTQWTARNGTSVVLEFGNRAAITIEMLTGISAFAFAFAPKPGFGYQAVLAFGCSAAWRKACGLGDMVLDTWIDHWMPHYFSDEYKELQSKLEALIASFPDAAEHSLVLSALTATHNLQDNSPL